jgi:hypothetical protein
MLSQNGAVVIENNGAAAYGHPDLDTTSVIPGTNGGVRFLGGTRKGDVTTVLLYVGAWWHRFIEPVIPGTCWGYDLRAIRGQTSGFSNHASGEAVDINAPAHPLGSRTLTPNQLAHLQALAITLRNVVQFGAFYTGRVDEMHSEIQIHGDPLARLAADIRAGRMTVNFPELVTAPPVSPAAQPEGFLMALSDAEQAEVLGILRSLAADNKIDGAPYGKLAAGFNDGRAVLNKVTWLADNETIEGYPFSRSAATFNDVRALLAQLAAVPTQSGQVDPAKLADAIAAKLGGLGPDIAKKVASELSSRLAS